LARSVTVIIFCLSALKSGTKVGFQGVKSNLFSGFYVLINNALKQKLAD